MIAIRVCPICKKIFEGRVGVPKVYCDECMMLEDFAASDKAREQSSWFFEDSEDSGKEDSGMHETGQEKLLDPLTDHQEEILTAAPKLSLQRFPSHSQIPSNLICLLRFREHIGDKVEKQANSWYNANENKA